MEHPQSRPRPRKNPQGWGTVLESIDELLDASPLDPTRIEPPALPPSPGSKGQPDRPRFRPSLRPPMALLCVFDDSLGSGETVRIRIPSFVIGRVEGNLVIPHDGGMSGRHAEIARRLVDDRYRWSLRDLGSTNGTFVRTARALLRDGQVLLIGGMRYRFDVPGEAATLVPRLVEVKPQGEGQAFPLTGSETWIGRDPRQCALVFDRPLVSPRHALIQARRRGHWMIQNAGSCDGLWLRVQEIALGRGGQFQCGEQRFLIRIL
jgi:hypothetical protein